MCRLATTTEAQNAATLTPLSGRLRTAALKAVIEDRNYYPGTPVFVAAHLMHGAAPFTENGGGVDSPPGSIPDGKHQGASLIHERFRAWSRVFQAEREQVELSNRTLWATCLLPVDLADLVQH